MGRRRAKTVAFNNNTTTTPHRAALAECTLLLLRRLPHVFWYSFLSKAFLFFSRAKKGRVERYARRVVRKQRACPCSLVFETTKKATISVQTAIATKTAMSFWDSVTTGAQNAAETTKLVSIVRPLFFSAFRCVLSPFSNSIAPRTTTVVYAGTDTRTNTRTLSLSKNDAENKTPSRSALLGATNQTNHAKLRRRVFPTHGAIQFRTRPTGVPQRAERHRRIPNENRREEQRNQRTESTNRKRRPIIIIINNNNNNNNASNNARLFGVPEHIRRKERRASKTTERKSKRRTEKSTHHRKRRPIVILITHIYCFHNVFVGHLNACARERKRERRARARKHT